MNLKRVISIVCRGRRKLPLVSLCVGVTVALALVLSIVSLAAAATPSFPDVPASHPYYTAITDLAGRGVISGYKNGNFGPGDNIQRQQFAKMLVLAGGYAVSESDVCPFVDVPVGGPTTLYPDNYIAVAASHHLTVGRTDTLFDPYSSITRYQVVTMVVRMIIDLQPNALAMPPSSFQGTAGWDTDPIHGANAAVAEYNGLLAGLDLSASDPYGFMTRGEAAVVLHNALVLLHPAVTTTTSVSTSSTTLVNTSSTASTTTTSTASSTTTLGPTTTTTLSTTTTTIPPKAQYAIAGLEQNTLTVSIVDQFGNPYPNSDVYLTSKILEGQNLSPMSNLFIGKTDLNGNVAHTWGQPAAKAWGVEEVTARVDNGTLAGLTETLADVQWIYDDHAAGTNYLSATKGQQKVRVAAGGPADLVTGWNGHLLRAYLTPLGSSFGSGTYVASTGLVFTVVHVWFTDEGFFVGADSTNTDNVPNWMYSLVP